MRVKHFWLLLLVLMTAACSKDNPSEQTTPPDEPVYYEVKLSLGGEITVDDEPLMRGTATNDIYGINVYVDEDGDGVISDHYAYGLFDNKEDMTIPLLSGYKYKFECSLVKNAKNTLYYGQAFNQSYSGFAYPFQNSATTSTMISNKFILGDVYLKGLTGSDAHIAGTTPTTSNAAVQSPNINRFYGVLSGYVPTEGGVATINLKRMVFGAKLIINGVVGGSVSVSGLWGDLNQTVTSNYEGDAIIYTVPSISTCYTNPETYSFTKNVSFSYDSNRGDAWDLSNSMDVTFKRNTLTTITINVSPDLASGSVSFTEEEMGDENIIDLEINTDGVIDTPVNPTE